MGSSGAVMAQASAGAASVTDLETALMNVIDPELGVDVVRLGLVRRIRLDSDGGVTLEMTLTSAACPLTDVIEDEVRAVTTGLVTKVRINWVWMPPWGTNDITDEGREMLRALGFHV